MEPKKKYLVTIVSKFELEVEAQSREVAVRVAWDIYDSGEQRGQVEDSLYWDVDEVYAEPTP